MVRRKHRSRKSKADPPPAREEQVVFADLRALARQPGFIHALCAITHKSNAVLTTGSFTAEDFAPVYDDERLLRTEVNLLTGLMLTGELDTSWPGPVPVLQMIAQALMLMKELHEAILRPAHEEFQRSLKGFQTGEITDSPIAKGVFLREAIFYGPESAFPFQYVDLARKRYAPDAEWLRNHVGFDMHDAAAVVEAIRDQLAERMLLFVNSLVDLPLENRIEESFLNCFVFRPDEIEQRVSVPPETVRNILASFTYPEGERNDQFKRASDFNKAAVFPIFSLGDGALVSLLEYGLSEALYENPFYWIAADKTYLGIHSQSRGRFTERFTRERLQTVFGDHFLTNNVVFRDVAGKDVAEADSLLIYGRRAYVIQAKSKRMTLESRAGDDQAIGRDFQKAVQEAYDQALAVIKAMQAASAPTIDGKLISLPGLADVEEYYPICVTSEHYPALSVQSRELLKTRDLSRTRPPLVFDVFSIDVFAEFLRTPLLFSDYLKKRALTNDSVVASHELVILAYHLRKNLHVGDDVSMISIHDSVMADLDLAMAVRRIGLDGPATPRGILSRFEGTELQPLFDAVNSSTRADVHRLGELLLDMDGKAADTLSRQIARIRHQTSIDGKEHDISMGFDVGGITVHCNRLPDSAAYKRLLTHVTMRKYAQRCDAWYGVTVSETGEPRIMLGDETKWQANPNLDHVSGDFKVTAVKRALEHRSKRKIGRNDPCPCGSGIKYKRCHGR
jgi:hypothetical protein